MQFFDEYYKLKEELISYPYARIEDIKLFAKVMNELAKRQYDANYIISELEQLQSAPVRIMLLESKIQKLLNKEAGLRRSIRSYEFMISEYHQRMIKLDHLTSIGFGDEEFSLITNIIDRVAKRENITLRKAVNKFLEFRISLS